MDSKEFILAGKPVPVGRLATAAAVALQELKFEGAGFPKQELEKAGHGYLVVGQRTWNGVALLARGADPILASRNLPGDPSDAQARFLEDGAQGSPGRPSAASCRRVCRTHG